MSTKTFCVGERKPDVGLNVIILNVTIFTTSIHIASVFYIAILTNKTTHLFDGISSGGCGCGCDFCRNNRMCETNKSGQWRWGKREWGGGGVNVGGELRWL